MAQAAVDHILPHLDSKSIVGVGTGSTANFFIDALARHKAEFDGAVASSEATAKRLKEHGIPVYEPEHGQRAWSSTSTAPTKATSAWS